MKVEVSPENIHFKSLDENLLSKDGRILVLYAIGKPANAFTIPERVVTLGAICWNDSKLKSITIPTSIAAIENNTFKNCVELSAINYNGTVKEWEALNKQEYWDFNSGVYTIYCEDGEIAKDGTVTYK